MQDRTPTERDPGLVLAGLHLRLGAAALARAELEMLATAHSLDAPGRVDLVEARWRSGDLTGAGALAKMILASEEEPVVALIVAAEAASALGRPTEARRLAGRALEIDRGGIDRIFAGMPRSSVWPSDPTEPLPPPAMLFPTERLVVDVPVRLEPPEDDVEPDATSEDLGPGLWDVPDAVVTRERDATGDPPVDEPNAAPAPHDRLAAARAALGSDDVASAALHLGLLVRLTPALAPEVIDAIGPRDEPALLMVLGDALRAAGRETEARDAYARATGGL